jgi:hypothetical protein
MSILAAASNSGNSDLANTALTLILAIVLGGAFAWFVFYCATHIHPRADVQVNADVRVSGTLRHEVTGGYQVEHTGGYQVEHTGSVEMRLAQEDRDRLDQLAATQLPAPPGNAALWREPDRQPAVYRTAAPSLPPARESRVLDRRPTWPEIES